MEEKISVERFKFERKKMEAKEKIAVMKKIKTGSKITKVRPQEIRWQHFE